MSESSANTLPPPPVATRDRARSRLRRWALPLVLLLIAGGWFGHFAYLRITLRPTPRPEYWEAKLAELDPPPPGAMPPEAVVSILSNLPSDFESLLNGEWDESRVDLVKATEVYESEAFKGQLAKVHEAAERGWCAPHGLSLTAYDWPQQLPCYRAWANALRTHARWAVEHRQDFQTAVGDWLTVFKLARQLRRPHMPISAFLAGSVEWQAANELLLITREHPGAIEPAFAKQVDAIVGQDQTARLLEDLRIQFHCYLEYIYVREGGDWLDVSATTYWRNGGMWTGKPQPLRAWNITSFLFHDLSIARRNVDRYFNACGRLNSIAECARLGRQLEPRDATAPGILTVLDGIGGPDLAAVGISSMLTQAYESRCTLEAALASLAIERYRHDRGGYPEGLRDLIPEFLSRLPIDYADRQPLRYRRTPEGYLLYSVGVNGQDDGGVGSDSARANFEWEMGRDVVFSNRKRADQ